MIRIGFGGKTTNHTRGSAAGASVFLDSGAMEAGLALSNGGLTVTRDATLSGSNQLVLATQSRSTGKYWYAVRMDGGDPGIAWYWGLVPSGFTDFPGNGASIGWYRGGPNTIYSGSSPTTNYNTAGVGIGDWMMICVDLDARLVWARPSSSALWNASGNPATGTNGAPFHASVATPLFPAMGLTASTSAATFNFGGSVAPITVPTGFASWDGSQPAP